MFHKRLDASFKWNLIKYEACYDWNRIKPLRMIINKMKNHNLWFKYSIFQLSALVINILFQTCLLAVAHANVVWATKASFRIGHVVVQTSSQLNSKPERWNSLRSPLKTFAHTIGTRTARYCRFTLKLQCIHDRRI